MFDKDQMIRAAINASTKPRQPNMKWAQIQENGQVLDLPFVVVANMSTLVLSGIQEVVRVAVHAELVAILTKAGILKEEPPAETETTATDEK